MPSNVWDGITYRSPNFNGCTVDVWELIKLTFHPTLYNGCNYLTMLGLKLIHVSKRSHGYLRHDDVRPSAATVHADSKTVNALLTLTLALIDFDYLFIIHTRFFKIANQTSRNIAAPRELSGISFAHHLRIFFLWSPEWIWDRLQWLRWRIEDSGRCSKWFLLFAICVHILSFCDILIALSFEYLNAEYMCWD